MSSATNKPYEIHIRPNQNWLKIDFSQLFEYRDLFFILVRKEFVVRYRQTILGPIWYLIQPLLTTLIFTIVFNRFSGLSTNGFPPVLFYLSGLTLWSYVSQNVNGTASIFLFNRDVFEKVYFPRIIFPAAVVYSNLLALAVQMTSLIGFILFFKITGAPFHPNLSAILFVVPLLVLQSALLSLGYGLMLSVFTIKYRDVYQLMAFLLQLWMYACPIVYPASKIPHQYRWLMYANPMGPIIENFRGCFLGYHSVPVVETITSILSTFVILIVGILLFQRAERTLVDVA
jgi:lipopolysaccharide transport system permease protein